MFWGKLPAKQGHSLCVAAPPLSLTSARQQIVPAHLCNTNFCHNRVFAEGAGPHKVVQGLALAGKSEAPSRSQNKTRW